MGRRIPNNSKLSECPNLGSEHKVYAMRVARPVQSPYKPTARDIDSVRTSFLSAFSDLQHRFLVNRPRQQQNQLTILLQLMKITSSRDTIGNLIRSTPGLKSDRIAQGLLRDPLLLLKWLLSENIAG